MPTRDRVTFALHAVAMFDRQDYPCRELVVVDDSARSELKSLLPADPRIRYVRSPRRESIGAKRNRACRAASGEFIAHWDDDDWYGARRLSAQLAPLLARRADITGLVTPAFLDLVSARCWGVTPALHRRLFLDDVAGGTLAYRRHLWDRAVRYPNVSLGEDAAFLAAARRRGARLERVDGEGLFVYVRHHQNSWRFVCGKHLAPAHWLALQTPPLPAEDHRFYAQFGRPRRRRNARVGRTAMRPTRRPFVTAIMPTKDRPDHVVRAIEYFQRQDYVSRELIIVDDGAEPIADLVAVSGNIRYVRLDEPLSLGEKRNRACALARGEVIVHWDDDDWYAPHRIRYQVEQLQLHRADVCGTSRLLYLDPSHRTAWLYRYPASAPAPWVGGSSLCYRVETWRRRPFTDIGVGEDTSFVAGRDRASTLVLSDHRFVVALLHDGNVSSRVGSRECWRRHPVSEVKRILGRDYVRYAAG